MNDEPTAPGESIRKELARRGWTQSDLARILGRPLPTINEIIVGKRSITPVMAVALGEVFEKSAEEWVALEAAYRLSMVQRGNSEVAERCRLYERAPVKEMERRGWIPATTSVDALRQALCHFFQTPSLDCEPDLRASTRKSGDVESLSSSQRAWCFRALQLAKSLKSERFNDESAKAVPRELCKLVAYPEDVTHVPEMLAKHGIRLVVIEPLQGTRLDGAALWIDESSPVIAVSLRYDRIDAFWFTLAHELAHVLHQDAISVDVDLVGERQVPSMMKEEQERRADNDAAEMLLPQRQLHSFITRVGPMYSKQRIIQFAHRMHIHPGIIVGQLQHAGEIGYAANREMLVKIRGIVIETALTDGWGKTVVPH